MNLLLFSNSTNFGEKYFGFPLPFIKNFLPGKEKKCLFFPFAGVTMGWDEYENKIKEKFAEAGHSLVSVHHSKNFKESIDKAEVIVIGGGNTFNLIYHLHTLKLIEPVRERVKSGIPYIGWSAGSNVACPSIATTNDMPVIQPPSFEGLNLIPFQINPHFTEATIPNHGGESRETRILEFLEINRNMKVLGLREGSLIQYSNRKAELLGKNGAKVFQYGSEPLELLPGSSLSSLFN